jgi:LPS-assembly protein
LPIAAPLRAALVLAALAAAVATRAADFCPAPPQAPRPPPSLVPGDHRIHIESDSATLGADGDALVSGRVRVLQDDRRIDADSVTYDRRTGRIGVKGSVDFEDPKLRVRSDSGSYLQSGGADFSEAAFQLFDRRGRGFAHHIDVQPGGKLSLEGVRYTTCPEGAQDWMLHASSIKLDTAREQGAARDAYLVFKGVPLFYTPYLSFPLGAARQSGFLYPNFSHTGNNGYAASVPYYFDLAPNYDLTLTPGYMSARGADLAGEYRYLTDDSHGRIAATFLPDDSQTHGGRNFLQFSDLTDLNAHNRIDVDVASVSDSNYFQDFAVGSAETSVTFLQRHASYLYRDDVWRIDAQLQNFQTIDIAVDPTLRPYSRVPQVDAQALWPLADTGLEFSLRSEAVDFLREVGTTGARLDLAPELRWSRRTAGYFFVPAIGWNLTQYDLQRVAPGGSTAPTLALPYGRLDTGLVFERDDAASGRPTQTIEPRMVYSYVPYRDQSGLPVFDTAVPDLNLTELYQTNRYVGGDRIGDANQLSLGVTTRWLDGSTGRQYLSATVGQTRYFSTPRVTLPGEAPHPYDGSDIIGDVTLTAYRDVNVKMDYQWSPYSNTVQKSEVSVQYRPDAARLVNLGYRFQHDVLDQWDGSFAWPILKRWRAVGRLVYSVMDRQTIEQVAGIEYTSCCWRVQLVQRRYVVNRTGALDTSVGLQIELLGLSSVRETSDSFLQRAIGGYSAVGPAPQTP